MPTIRELRESKGWTQVELAAKASVSHQTISSMESGSAVQKSTLRLVAQALGVLPEEITGVNVLNRVKRS